MEYDASFQSHERDIRFRLASGCMEQILEKKKKKRIQLARTKCGYLNIQIFNFHRVEESFVVDIFFTNSGNTLAALQAIDFSTRNFC